MSHAAAQILDPWQPELDFELIQSDGQPLDSTWQRKGINLTVEVIYSLMARRGRDDFYAGGDMFVYYSVDQARAVAEEVKRQLSLFGPPEILAPETSKKAFRGPDVFAVVGGVVWRPRDMWVAWEEGGRLPNVILEYQSTSTAVKDADEKQKLYEEVLETPEYFRYGEDASKLGEYRDALAGFRLKDGVYVPIEPDERGFLWSEVLGCYLGRWTGYYGDDKEKGTWIRLYDADGELVPTEAEAERRQKEAERRRAETAELRAETERQRAEAAQAEIARLRKLLESDGATTSGASTEEPTSSS